MENMIGELRRGIARRGPIWHLIMADGDMLAYAQSLRNDWVNRKISEWKRYETELKLIERPPKVEVWSHYSDNDLIQFSETWRKDISTVLGVIDHELGHNVITHLTLKGKREFIVSDHDIIITSEGFCFLWPGE